MLRQLRELTTSLEIVFVENGSTDNTRSVIEALRETYPEVQLLALPIADYGGALRAGMENASGSMIASFDVDYWDVPFVRDAMSGEPAAASVAFHFAELLRQHLLGDAGQGSCQLGEALHSLK